MTATSRNNTFIAVTETAEAMRTGMFVSFADRSGLGSAAALARRCER